MPDNQNHDEYGNYRDNAGTTYQTPDNQPPAAWTPVKIHEDGQVYDGTWVGGYVEKSP